MKQYKFFKNVQINLKFEMFKLDINSSSILLDSY